MAAISKSLNIYRALLNPAARRLTSTTTAAVQPPPPTPQPTSRSDHAFGTVHDVLKVKGEKFFYTYVDALVIDAVKEMVKHNIGSLIIVEGAKKRAVGIVTETDYLEKVIVLGRSSKSTLVKDIMSTKEFTSVTPSATLHHCMELMTERKIRHIPVIEDGSQRVLGMVSVGDIVSELVAAHKRDAEHLRSFISGGY